ncbi:39S ribosomal protein L54, mitochondrial [Belonocnema kinseyi]|uniref:39S ribosomal protein L54, mitochondrial n=1 Tax=Belonocnema kinseyi TaxID=2817044 RepID=UPI00143D3652|nr:39S ribosomal protein L54, mitochondrial [Belonocnema kinseyi]
MSLFTMCRLISFHTNLQPSLNFCAQARNYAVPSLGKKGKIGKKSGSAVEKKVLPVETDVNKLLKYVCGSNIYKEGQDMELMPDSEYPDWLWTIRTGPAPPLAELDPNTKTYWRRVRKMGIKRYNKLSSLKKF